MGLQRSSQSMIARPEVAPE